MQDKEGREKMASAGFWTLKLIICKRVTNLKKPRVMKWGKGPIRRKHEETKNYRLYNLRRKLS